MQQGSSMNELDEGGGLHAVRSVPAHEFSRALHGCQDRYSTLCFSKRMRRLTRRRPIVRMRDLFALPTSAGGLVKPLMLDLGAATHTECWANVRGHRHGRQTVSGGEGRGAAH